jgi:hypothetical protein
MIVGNLNFEESKLAKNSLIPGVYYGACQFTQPTEYQFLEPFEEKVFELHDAGTQNGHLNRHQCSV